MRRNFLLVYELLDELLDYGLPQNSATERLKRFVAIEPVAVRPRAPVSPCSRESLARLLIVLVVKRGGARPVRGRLRRASKGLRALQAARLPYLPAGRLATWWLLRACAQGVGGSRIPGDTSGPTEVVKSVLDTSRTGGCPTPIRSHSSSHSATPDSSPIKTPRPADRLSPTEPPWASIPPALLPLQAPRRRSSSTLSRS